MSAKPVVKPMGANPGWESISLAVTRLFDLKRYPGLAFDLPSLNEKVVAISKSELGQFIGEYYHDHILSHCMEKWWKQELAEEKNVSLINKLAEIWVQFYTSILPTLLAIFASIQPRQNKLSIRSLTLIGFRDFILLRTKFAASLQSCPGPFPPQIQQMLLVLQSVHRSPPDSRFFVLQDLASRVVDNYLPMVTRSFSKGKSDGFLPMSLEENVRSSRAVTMELLDSGPAPPPPEDRKNSLGHSRRHSLGQMDRDIDSPEPVTRL